MSKELDNLSRDEKLELLLALDEKEQRANFNVINTIFPATGGHARDLYPKHMQFVELTAHATELAFIAGNRVGKTFLGSFCIAVWLTGIYPDWWNGRRFNRPVDVWVAGVTASSVKEAVQSILLGTTKEGIGTGLIPKSSIVSASAKPGIPGAFSEVVVKGTYGLSKVSFLSYETGREKFQGATKDIVLLDEEPRDAGIYSECITRVATTNGLLMATFTPLLGLSEVVMSFLPDGHFPESPMISNGKYVVTADWDDVPEAQLSKDMKEKLLASYLPHEKEARSKGLPSVGSGKVYPIPEEELLVDPFTIPFEWKIAYGMDTGWNRTAVIWAAIDNNTKVVYLFDEYYRGQAEPAVHVAAIKARGEWVPGIIDYAGGVVEGGQRKTTTQQYRDLGLNVIPADKSVDAGLLAVYRAMSEGKLKVFRTLKNWLNEYRIYRRDDKGNIVKKNDHLMDAMRYLILTGLKRAQEFPNKDIEDSKYDTRNSSDQNPITGY